MTGYRIENSFGEYAVILDYGAMIQSLCVLDAWGAISDVVMGPCQDDFENGKFSGSILGRCANRIAYGRFTIDGHMYQLNTVNNTPGAPHHLHGGAGALSKKFFTASYQEQGQSVTLTCHDGGEDGWECGADVKVTYSFGDDHALSIAYELVPEGPTVLCPSNHVHFNLDMPRSIENDRFRVLTDKYAPADPQLGMPNGEISSVEPLPIDFRVPRSLVEAVCGDKNHYFGDRPRLDVCYVFDDPGFHLAAELECPASGRRLRTYTDAQCLILFTPNMPRKMVFKGMEFQGLMAVCMETQFVPNAVNCPQYRSPVFQPGEVMRSKTVYQFEVIQQQNERKG